MNRSQIIVSKESESITIAGDLLASNSRGGSSIEDDTGSCSSGQRKWGLGWGGGRILIHSSFYKFLVFIHVHG
jgi:hypothetical protein